MTGQKLKNREVCHKQALTQLKLLDKSFPVPRGMIAVGGTGSRPCL